jgi:hypothetical protein
LARLHARGERNGVRHVWAMLKKRPCQQCRRWFYPDARIGARQRVCSKAQCQSARRKQTQSKWRSRNPEYFVARRIVERAEAIEQARTRVSGADGKAKATVRPRMPRPLNRLPWALAQDEFGVQGAEFLGVFGRLLTRPAQAEMQVQVLDSS